MTEQVPELTIEKTGKLRYRVHLPVLDYMHLLAPHRRGEVAMVIQRAPGWILLQTKGHYPPGTFRVPTGGINKGETPEQTMLRELREEANLEPGSHRKLLRLDYRVAEGRSDFFTEAYLIEGPRGELMPIDRKEAITGWREAQISELATVAAELRALEPPRQGWGLFRSAVHQLLARILAPAET